MKIKKYITGIAVFLLCITALSNNRIYAVSYDSSDRMQSLGIMDITGRENNSVTREDFVIAIVNASGLHEEAYSSIGSTIFSDVKKDSTLSGYVNIALKKGLMVGMTDKKFHPQTKMTYSQVCTLLIRALGYSDKDLQGVWPNNYINKAKNLGISDGVTLLKNNEVSLRIFTSLLDRMLDCNIKTSSGVDTNKTYADISGISNESYRYGLIANPVYSKPVVASGINSNTTYVGNINLSGASIIKNGQSIGIKDIEDNDVIYQVSDTLGLRKYILVIDNKISGKITSISSSQIQIDNKDYKYGSGIDYRQILSGNDSLKTGDYATILLGYDGKVVDFFDIGQQDNGNFAFLVNYTTNALNYSVKLYTVDGNTREYYTNSNPSYYKGRLVKYNKINSDTVELTYVDYSSNYYCEINKENRKIDSSYVSHNVKIFNLVSDNAGNNSDSQVYLSNWYDFSNADITSGQILHLNKAGSYDDINIIVVKDLFNDEWKAGIVTDETPVTSKIQQTNPDGSTSLVDKVSGYNYSIIVDGQLKNYKSTYDIANAGQIIEVRMINNSIDSVTTGYFPVVYGNILSSADVNRIKINNTIYYLDTNTTVYFKSPGNEYTMKNISDIISGKSYPLVTIYLDSSNNNKVSLIVVNQ